MDYRGTHLKSETIPQHQVIIPSYRFTCCGNITEWGVDVNPGGNMHDGHYTLNFQVWRPSPTVDTTGCYSLVRNNTFTSVSLTNQVAIVTPLPQEQIEFQPGDVLGLRVENTKINDGGVVLLIDSPQQGDNGYETEEVWHADLSNSPISSNGECQVAVGSQPGRALNTMISAAPVISVSYSTTICPMPTSLPPPPQPPAQTPLIDSDPASQNVITQCTNNTALIAGITIMAIVIILLTLVLIVVVSMKLKQFHKNGAAYSSGPQDTYYNYSTMEIQTRNLIDMDKNYASTDEANLNERYAMKVTTERNIAYGTRHQSSPSANKESNDQDYL